MCPDTANTTATPLTPTAAAGPAASTSHAAPPPVCPALSHLTLLPASPHPHLARCSVEYYENGSKIGSQMTNANAITEKINWEGNAPAGKKLTIK